MSEKAMLHLAIEGHAVKDKIRRPRTPASLVTQERAMAHHNSNVGFFSMIGGSLLAAALLVALLVGGEIAGPKVRLNSSPFTNAR